MGGLIDLSGKNAIVTGGSRGVGRATAVLLARAGASIGLGYPQPSGRGGRGYRGVSGPGCARVGGGRRPLPSGGRGGALRSRGQRVRRTRHLRRQPRDMASRRYSYRRDDRRAVARYHGSQSPLGLLYLPSRGPAPQGRRLPRPREQHRRTERGGVPRGLRVVEGCDDFSGEGVLHRARAPRDHRERGRPRVDRHGDVRGALSKSRGGRRSRRGSRSAVSRCPRTSRDQSSSSARGWVATSPARSSTLTAGPSWWGEDAADFTAGGELDFSDARRGGARDVGGRRRGA